MSNEAKQIEQPQVYAACLAAYNCGFLHGKWIDATQGVERIEEEIQTMLKTSPISGTEEWAFHDSQFLGDISEHEGVESVAEKGEFINEHGALGIAVLNHFCGDLVDAKRVLEDCYCGEHESELDYAYELVGDCYADQMPEFLATYFDYAAFARDLFMTDYFSLCLDCKTHVFRCE